MAVDVADATFDNMRKLLGANQQTVEPVGVIAAYNMVSRFLVARGSVPDWKWAAL